MELKAEELHQLRIDNEKRHQEYERQKAIRIEFENQRKQDLQSFKEALDSSARWHTTFNLRAFIYEVESRARQNGDYTEELQQKLERLRKQADWYDPFINAIDELLGQINKQTLELPRSEYY